MKANQIQVGHTYVAKVSGSLVPVTVLEIVEDFNPFTDKRQIRYRCRNKRTGREILVRSPQRFRSEAGTVWGPKAKAVRDQVKELFV